jgi:hypothetical protein
MNTELVGVQLSGACAEDAGPGGVFSEFGDTVEIMASGPGDCHFDLTFADGFTYSGDVQVQFVEEHPGCACPPYTSSSPSTVTVSNPSSTCITNVRTPDVLASQQGGPTGVVVDATSIYWVVQGFDGWMYDGSVMKASLDGSTVTTLATGQGIPGAIAVDATSVYWTAGACDQDAECFEQGSPSCTEVVMKIPVGGGTPVTLASGMPYSGSGAIAVDATSVYWTGFDTVMSVPLAGGTPVTLASGQGGVNAVAVDATSVYWTNAGTSANGFADGGVMQVPLTGGATTTLAAGQMLASSLVVGAAGVFWATSAAGGVSSIVTAPRQGGAPTTLASGHFSPGGIAVDSTNVYWTNARGGIVMTVPIGGGTVTELASGQVTPVGMAVDDTSLYWANVGSQGGPNDGSIAKLTPK